MIYPRECYATSTYDDNTQQLLLRRDRGMYVPFVASLLLANASNHALYLHCEGGRQDTLRKRWERTDPACRGNKPPIVTFALAAHLASEYATKYATKPEGMNEKVPLLRVVRALTECGARDELTDSVADPCGTLQQGRRFLAKACNAVNGAQVVPATMAALYLLEGDDHFVSHDFVTHPTNLFTNAYTKGTGVCTTLTLLLPLLFRFRTNKFALCIALLICLCACAVTLRRYGRLLHRHYDGYGRNVAFATCHRVADVRSPSCGTLVAFSHHHYHALLQAAKGKSRCDNALTIPVRLHSCRALHYFKHILHAFVSVHTCSTALCIHSND